jgi:DNA-damage-inducible protein J
VHNLISDLVKDTRVCLGYKVAQGKSPMADSVVRARIDPALKKSARAVLKRIGLTTSDAVRLMMVRIAAEKKLPFDPLVPNNKKIAAKKEARGG